MQSLQCILIVSYVLRSYPPGLIVLHAYGRYPERCLGHSIRTACSEAAKKLDHRDKHEGQVIIHLPRLTASDSGQALDAT